MNGACAGSARANDRPASASCARLRAVGCSRPANHPPATTSNDEATRTRQHNSARSAAATVVLPAPVLPMNSTIMGSCRGGGYRSIAHVLVDARIAIVHAGEAESLLHEPT